MKKFFPLFLCILLTLVACSNNEISEFPISPEEPFANPGEGIVRTDRSTANPDIFCINPSSPSISDFQVYQTPKTAEPPARQAFIDPVFKTCIVRVTDRYADLSPNDPSSGLKNEYSRVQSFNADESLILVRGTEATWYIYDAFALQPLTQLLIDSDPRWDAQEPGLLYFSDATFLYSYNVYTAETTLLYDFSWEFPDQDLAAVWTRYEGSPSLDSHYYGLMAQNQDWETIGFLVFDLNNKTVISKMELAHPYEVDSVTISPAGNYFLAYFDNYCEPGQLGSESSPCGLMVYDQSLQHGRGLLRLVGHSDLAFDVQGKEVLVYQDIDQDTISYLELATGDITNLLEIDFSHNAIGLHFSGQAFLQPGWVIVSTYTEDEQSYTWMDNEVFIVELKPGGRVVRVAHTHSIIDSTQEHDYWAEPQATSNRDLTRILFTSNWDKSGSGDVNMYLIQLPTDWTKILP